MCDDVAEARAEIGQGGVTSSSLEVLAGLGLSDEEYKESMMFKDGKPSSFCRSPRQP